MIALFSVADVAEAKDAREPWSMKPCSLRMMTLKSRCNRTVKDETSHRVCQTPGQLGTNMRTSVANTAQAR
uniref:Uncharacterized protein n=1 Tax=Oryza glumipatula TaxID=40148 RepID=A0A0E0A9D6_9ORYZ